MIIHLFSEDAFQFPRVVPAPSNRKRAQRTWAARKAGDGECRGADTCQPYGIIAAPGLHWEE